MVHIVTDFVTRVMRPKYLFKKSDRYISGWIFEKVIDSYKPSVPSTPLPSFPVPSSYKNGSCLNIRTSLDILDNIHPRK